jgi:hypothetical protein
MTKHHSNFEAKWLQEIMERDCPETKKKKLEYREKHLKGLADDKLKERIDRGEKWLEEHWEDKEPEDVEKWDAALIAYEAMVEEARNRKLYKQGEK